MVFVGSGPLVKRCDGFDRSLWSSHMAAGPVLLKPVLLSETKKIIENQHETQMSHRIKLRTSAGTKFKSLLPSHEAVTLFQFQTIILYYGRYIENVSNNYTI